MRTTILVLLVALGCAAAAVAQEPDSALGRFQVGLGMDVMMMQHETFETDDAGFYIGLEAYAHLRDNWYVGAAFGEGGSMRLFDFEDSSFLPVEVNAKRAFDLPGPFTADLGGGLCCGRISYTRGGLWEENSPEVEQWVPGGQLFADLVLDANLVFLGLQAKYQLTGDADEIQDMAEAAGGWDYSNFRIGVHLGIMIPDR